MFYTRLKILCDPSFSEILMAEVAETGFDSFLETDDGFEAYAEADHVDENALTEVLERYRQVTTLSHARDAVEKKNWNEEWEKNVEPIIVDDQCLVRAEFHQIKQKFPYEIIITPKMSFGTGHHQTTHLMLKSQLKIDHVGKRVMDAGCGTAILSIMASKRGASIVDAFDIDEWSVVNGEENAAVNQCTNIRIRQGKIADLTFEESFDIVLANINRNILVSEMGSYAQVMKPGALLLLSGFYEADIPVLLESASAHQLTEVFRDARETWATLALQKK